MRSDNCNPSRSTPRALHVFDEGNQRSITATRVPVIAALYVSCLRNSWNPISLMARASVWLASIPLHVEVFDGHRLVLAAELHGQLMQGIVPHILVTPM